MIILVVYCHLNLYNRLLNIPCWEKNKTWLTEIGYPWMAAESYYYYTRGKAFPGNGNARRGFPGIAVDSENMQKFTEETSFILL